MSSDLFTSKENTLTRIAIAGFLHETNTFSPIPTTLNDFNNHSGPYAGYLDKEQLLGYRLKRSTAQSAASLTRPHSSVLRLCPSFGQQPNLPTR